MSMERTSSGASDPTTAPRTGVVTELGGGRLLGHGSTPHLDPDAAAAFSIGEFDIATVPSLPQRSIHESMLGQVVEHTPGVSVGADGGLVVDPARFDPAVGADADAVDLTGEGFASLRAFLDLAVAIGHDAKPVKWQLVGPVTLGRALTAAGVGVTDAFGFAERVVRAHLGAVGAQVRRALPASDQVVLIDEPWLVELMSHDFPVAPDEAVDLMSSAMASAATVGDVVGVHCCGPCDLATLLASGPQIISIPADPALLDYAGYLDRFLDDGGIVAWGVVPTDRPVGPSSDRYWKALAELWCGLVERGIDAGTLRRQALITPTCGFAHHQVSVARRLTRLTGEVARKVKDQAAATRFALGA
ncbi:MAG: hypothetical protein AAGG08_07080 [Actinomycetota bacterium]